ncbi:MAG: cytochrome c oxidase assembly protein, partial [Candidatus Binatota bacterium]
ETGQGRTGKRANRLSLDRSRKYLEIIQCFCFIQVTLAPGEEKELPLAFSVYQKGETLIILALVVTDMSDHPPRGYELHIKGYELFTDGKLVDKIPPG